VRAHLCHDGPGLTEGGDELPDAELVRAASSGITWAPGARDGVSRYFAESEEEDDRPARIHSALVQLADSPGRRTRAQARALLRGEDVRSVVDDVLERLGSYPPRDQERLYAELRRVLLESGYRDEVKFALAIVGAFGNPADADVFRTLGRHEEFTLYAAIALGNTVEDPAPELAALLSHVSGWGRTELVELLLRDPKPELYDLLLRDGLGVGNALTLAVGCELHEALAAPDVDDELLEAALGIFEALTYGFDSPDDLYDYPHAGIATERLLGHLAPRAETLQHFQAAFELRRFLEQGDDERRAQAGFDAARLERVRAVCDEIVGRPEWRPRAEAALTSADDDARRAGLEAAKALGLPLHDYLVQQIELRPNDGYMWFELLRGADAERIDEAIALAERVLDLDAVATGPDLLMIAPPGSDTPLDAFDYIVQELRGFPGEGWNLLRAALRSPVIRHRNVALEALSEWESFDRAAVEACLEDPDERVRERAAAVLAGEPFPE
jgi:hypothetical protein